MVLHDVYERCLQKQDPLGDLAKPIGDEGEVILDGLVKKTEKCAP